MQRQWKLTTISHVLDTRHRHGVDSFGIFGCSIRCCNVFVSRCHSRVYTQVSHTIFVSGIAVHIYQGHQHSGARENERIVSDCSSAIAGKGFPAMVIRTIASRGVCRADGGGGRGV